MRSWLLSLLLFPLLIGCTGAVNDFVEGGGGAVPPPPTPIPSVDVGGAHGFKLSPGSVISTSSVANMRATITPTNRQMTSPAANATMSLSSSQTR